MPVNDPLILVVKNLRFCCQTTCFDIVLVKRRRPVLIFLIIVQKSAIWWEMIVTPGMKLKTDLRQTSDSSRKTKQQKQIDILISCCFYFALLTNKILQMSSRKKLQNNIKIYE